MELMGKGLQFFEIDIKQENFKILWLFLNVSILITLKEVIPGFEENCKVLLKKCKKL
jgi:hypothetical protein